MSQEDQLAIRCRKCGEEIPAAGAQAGHPVECPQCQSWAVAPEGSFDPHNVATLVGEKAGTGDSTLAILSLVFGALSWLPVGLVFSPVAIVLGTIAERKGRTLGGWGIILGILGLLLGIVWAVTGYVIFQGFNSAFSH
jgi:hypothetical protein